MSDLSSVVSFFAAGPEELEISRILDLRGPGRLFSFTDRVSDGIEDEDGTEGNNPTLEPVSSVGLSGVAATFTAVLDAVGQRKEWSRRVATEATSLLRLNLQGLLSPL